MEMDQTNSRNLHRPHHMYDGHTYFVTGRCIGAKHYFYNEQRKNIWRNVCKESIERFGIKMYAWVLLENHYHILFSLPYKEVCTETDFVPQSVTPRDRKERSDEMSAANFVSQQDIRILVEFIRKIHKDSARKLNQLDNTPARKIWYQYYDRCIRNIPDFWKHFNYILKNPYKHGLVDSLGASFAYIHSSNPTWLFRFGADGFHEGFCKYPVAEVAVE